MQAPPSFQQGGYIKPIILPDIIIGILFATGIAFVNEIPSQFIKLADTLVSKTLIFIFLLYLLSNDKWILSLLLVLFTLRLFRLETNINEPFISQMIVDDVDNKEKWFVEEVLHENPTKIKEKIIEVESVQ